MPASDAEENTQLDNRFGSSTPTTWHFAVLTTLPASDGTGSNEPSDAAYARVAVTNNGTNFPAAASGVQAVSAEVKFPQAGEAWAGVGIAVFSAASGGDPAYWLATTITVAAGQQVRFNSGEIEFTA